MYVCMYIRRCALYVCMYVCMHTCMMQVCRPPPPPGMIGIHTCLVKAPSFRAQLTFRPRPLATLPGNSIASKKKLELTLFMCQCGVQSCGLHWLYARDRPFCHFHGSFRSADLVTRPENVKCQAVYTGSVV